MTRNELLASYCRNLLSAMDDYPHATEAYQNAMARQRTMDELHRNGASAETLTIARMVLNA